MRVLSMANHNMGSRNMQLLIMECPKVGRSEVQWSSQSWVRVSSMALSLSKNNLISNFPQTKILLLPIDCNKLL